MPVFAPTVSVAPTPAPTFAPTTKCEGKTFSDSAYELFFDQKCVQRKKPRFSDICPVEVVDHSMETFFGSLRIESQFSDYVGVLWLFIAANQGGIPRPKFGDNSGITAGTLFWGMWMFVAILQYYITLISLMMVMVAYFAMRRQYGDCMEEWDYNMKIMDVVSLGTFSFQPVILTKQ